MTHLLSPLGAALALKISSDVFAKKALFGLVLCITLSNGSGKAYGSAKGINGGQGIQPMDHESTYHARRIKREDELPIAKIELVVMLDPDISDYIDMNYAKIEFCRLFAEAQEVFDTMTERKVIVELSALHSEQEGSSAYYIDDNVVHENGAVDVLGTIGDVAEVVQQWDQRYDIYLLLTRRPLVAVFGNDTIINIKGYSVTGGACQEGKNIAVAKYSYRNIMHQITHLLGAVHADDIPPVTTTCREGNYTNIITGGDALIRTEKGFASCTEEYMKDFLKSGNATCLYSEDILDNLDCGSIVPEIG